MISDPHGMLIQNYNVMSESQIQHSNARGGCASRRRTGLGVRPLSKGKPTYMHTCIHTYIHADMHVSTGFLWTIESLIMIPDS